ncbi:MAG: hypothetical protein AB1644_02130 [Candidatus Zixiibacteriota bacterium]
MKETNVSQMERELVRLLNEEYSFYQSLYLLLDKQRDLIKYDRDEHLLDLFAEIERCHVRIKESEKKLVELRGKTPSVFQAASDSSEVRKMVNCITTLVKKNINLVSENEAYVQERQDRIRRELEELRGSDKILQYFRQEEPSPQFVDGRK